MQASNSNMFQPIYRKAKNSNGYENDSKKKDHKATHDFREKRRNRHIS